MPDPAHKPMSTQSAELRAILAAQKPTPRWLYRLKRAGKATWAALQGLLGSLLLIAFALLAVRACATKAAASPAAANAAATAASNANIAASSLARIKAKNTASEPLDLDRLIPALERVESGGDPKAIGDGGKALGILQIWEVVIIDVNRAKGTSYTHEDAFDPEKARAICRAYLSIYCTERRLGRKPTMEDAARIWNGGPNGFKKAATVKYWHKVKAAL
jgi:hypothetical protein